jgi:hypothetical protein
MERGHHPDFLDIEISGRRTKVGREVIARVP